MPRWLIAAAVVVLGLAGYLLWPKRQATGPVAAPQGVTIQEATPVQTTSATPMQRLPLEEIRPEMVSYITQQNGRWVLVFLDGSRREVYPFEINLLPEQLRFQMGYERGGS